MRTTSLAEYLNSGGKGKNDIGSHFFFFNSFDDTICWNDCMGLVLIRIVDQQFYFCRFADQVTFATKIRTSVTGRYVRCAVS
jgi:hypothetical protein